MEHLENAGFYLFFFFLGCCIVGGLIIGTVLARQENAEREGIKMTKQQEDGILGLIVAIGLILAPIAAIFEVAKKTK